MAFRAYGWFGGLGLWRLEFRVVGGFGVWRFLLLLTLEVFATEALRGLNLHKAVISTSSIHPKAPKPSAQWPKVADMNYRSRSRRLVACNINPQRPPRGKEQT